MTESEKKSDEPTGGNNVLIGIVRIAPDRSDKTRLDSPSGPSEIGNETVRACHVVAAKYNGSIICSEFEYLTVFDPRTVVEFIQRTITGGVDLVVIRTAAALEKILSTAATVGYKDRLIDALSDIEVVATGPETTAALKKIRIEPSLIADDPCRGPASGVDRDGEDDPWRQLLVALDRGTTVLNRNVAIETGSRAYSLAAGLAARGANVLQVDPFAVVTEKQVKSGGYLVDDSGLIAQLGGNQIDILVFTSVASVVHFVQLVQSFLLQSFDEHPNRLIFSSVLPDRMVARLRHLLDGVLVVAAGKHTATIASDRIPGVDVAVITDGDAGETVIGQLIENRQRGNKTSAAMNTAPAGTAPETSDPFALDRAAAWYDSPFMKACRGEATDVTPVWMMRQAGRYMQEYRKVRAKVSFLELCANPQLCSEVMCTAVEKLGVDAAIIFSDLLPILVPMGCDLEFVKGDGPVIHNPVRTTRDIDRIRPLENNDELMFVMETVAQTRKDLPAAMPLIGFAGAPFTLASYMIEGGASRNYAHTKTLMYTDPIAWDQLMQHLAVSISIYLRGQVENGAQCLQIFDSWAGCLSVGDYRKFALPYLQQIIASLPPEIPVINFATGNPALLPMLAETKAAVIGIDWRVNLSDAWATVGYDKNVQGNLDPTVLLTGPEEIRRQAAAVLDQAAGRAGHIFNLGHGILPQTPVENAIALVDAVHELSSR